MNPMPMLDERIREEARYANSIQEQTGCSRSEALRIAAKWGAEQFNNWTRYGPAHAAVFGTNP